MTRLCFLLVVPCFSILLTSISKKEKRKKKKSWLLVILKIVQIFEVVTVVANNGTFLCRTWWRISHYSLKNVNGLEAVFPLDITQLNSRFWLLCL